MKFASSKVKLTLSKVILLYICVISALFHDHMTQIDQSDFI